MPRRAISPEYRRILDAVAAIPEGFVRTYGDLSPGAPRLTGTVLRHHGDGVPWWRVVRADGSAAQGERQLTRLQAEGVPMKRAASGHGPTRVDLAIARMVGDVDPA